MLQIFSHSFLSTYFIDLIFPKPRDLIFFPDNRFCKCSSLLPYLVIENKFQSPIQLPQNDISIFHKKKQQTNKLNTHPLTHIEHVKQINHKTHQLVFLLFKISYSNTCILYKEYYLQRKQTT